MKKTLFLSICVLFLLTIASFPAPSKQREPTFSQSAHAQGPCVAGPHSGTISTDESWCLADSPHLISGGVTVDSGVVLTIEPGVQVKFDCGTYPCNRRLIINGTLDAQGTAGQAILFTSDAASPSPGDWGQIRLASSSTGNSLDYVTIEYGGYDFIGTQPILEVEGSPTTINHTTIQNGSGIGLRVAGISPSIYNTQFLNNGHFALLLAGSAFPDMDNLSASGNGYDAITLNNVNYSIDYTWGADGITTYLLNSNISVNEGVTMTILPGTTVLSYCGTYPCNRSLLVDGTLIAQGTSGEPILFSSAADTPNKGDWGQIHLSNTSVNSVLDYITVEYGGYRPIPYNDDANIYASTSSLLIDHCTTRHSSTEGMRIQNASPTVRNIQFIENDGMALRLDGSAFPDLSNLSASGNGHDAININSTTYTVNYTWGEDGISEYILRNDITINEGIVVTIIPGTTVKIACPQDTYPCESDLLVQGTLQSQGTAVAPITITSAADTPAYGDWGHIYFQETSSNSLLEYVTVEYGGAFLADDQIRADTSSLTIRYSTIARSGNDGIKLDGGAPTIEFNTIMDNNAFGLQNIDDTVTAVAECNYWGDETGPTHASNPGGLGDEVSDYVDFDPWLTSPDDDCTPPTPPSYELYLPVILKGY
jgi:hypothetical protein